MTRSGRRPASTLTRLQGGPRARASSITDAALGRRCGVARRALGDPREHAALPRGVSRYEPRAHSRGVDSSSPRDRARARRRAPRANEQRSIIPPDGVTIPRRKRSGAFRPETPRALGVSSSYLTAPDVSRSRRLRLFEGRHRAMSGCSPVERPPRRLARRSSQSLKERREPSHAPLLAARSGSSGLVFGASRSLRSRAPGRRAPYGLSLDGVDDFNRPRRLSRFWTAVLMCSGGAPAGVASSAISPGRCCAQALARAISMGLEAYRARQSSALRARLSTASACSRRAPAWRRSPLRRAPGGIGVAARRDRREGGDGRVAIALPTALVRATRQSRHPRPSALHTANDRTPSPWPTGERERSSSTRGTARRPFPESA